MQKVIDTIHHVIEEDAAELMKKKNSHRHMQMCLNTCVSVFLIICLQIDIFTHWYLIQYRFVLYLKVFHF